MTDFEIMDGITAVVREALDDDTIILTPGSVAGDFAGWVSIKNIIIAVATGMRFSVKFRAAEIESLKEIGDFATLIRKKKAA